MKWQEEYVKERERDDCVSQLRVNQAKLETLKINWSFKNEIAADKNSKPNESLRFLVIQLILEKSTARFLFKQKTEKKNLEKQMSATPFFFFDFLCVDVWEVRIVLVEECVYTSQSERHSANSRHLDRNRIPSVQSSFRNTLTNPIQFNHTISTRNPLIFPPYYYFLKYWKLWSNENQDGVPTTCLRYLCSKCRCRGLRKCWSNPGACDSPCTCNTSCATTWSIKVDD